MTEEPQISLAPMAGAGVGKKLADLLLSDADFIPLMRQTALDCLNAMAPRRWDKASESWVADPDFRIRAQMFFGLLAHMEGEPVKRIIHQHLGGSGTVDPLEALRESPALREAASRMLDKASFRSNPGERSKAKAAERKAAKAGAVVVVEDEG